MLTSLNAVVTTKSYTFAGRLPTNKSNQLGSGLSEILGA